MLKHCRISSKHSEGRDTTIGSCTVQFESFSQLLDVHAEEHHDLMVSSTHIIWNDLCHGEQSRSGLTMLW